MFYDSFYNYMSIYDSLSHSFGPFSQIFLIKMFLFAHVCYVSQTLQPFRRF